MAPELHHSTTNQPLPCIIDTDVAIDDWMAMLFLLCHPQVNVQAITVAATGEAHAKPGVRTVQGLLALAGNESAAVAVGRSTPLRGRQAFPLALRLAMDVRLFLRAIRRIRPLLRGQAFYLWDPLAAAVAVHPEVVTCEQRRMAVMQEPGRELGRVVEDAEGGVVDIAVQVDRPAFERAFVASLTGAWRSN